MLSLQRHDDFQVFTAPHNETALVNPPSFNWPQADFELRYHLELEQVNSDKRWEWQAIQSPHQLDFKLACGEYRWRVTCSKTQAVSDWIDFSITENVEDYLTPTASELFELCADRDQFLMYFDEDIDAVREASPDVKQKLLNSLTDLDLDTILYPTHYRRGLEEGKRTAIANVRNWIDRELIALTLLYKIWGDEACGIKARDILLRLAEWSPEGPATLVRPLTWGDEVGLSLSRNLYLAYHWLAPLLTSEEKRFIRPLLVRIAYQMEERLEQDQFQQFPGHSHTSRLPAYLGIAALTLHKEFKPQTCERWLNYSLMIYRGVLPFYGGRDGSWVEGPFYSSSYSKWHHPFFLSVERLSDFSFYNHPFYKNYVHFAQDFVATQERIHAFGDGFWCLREGKEWPGFFAQNPLRIYAERFGSNDSICLSNQLESQIDSYKLHLLDIVPTVKQSEYKRTAAALSDKQSPSSQGKNRYYDYAGIGKSSQAGLSLYYRASQFGNSSHRHGDQGNFALIDNGMNVLTPSGSYGYRFGSKHHALWTRQTLAHNLPLLSQQGQKLDCPTSTAKVVQRQQCGPFQIVTIDLSQAYADCHVFKRTLIQVADQGLIVCDHIELPTKETVQWRLHSPLEVSLTPTATVLMDENKHYELKLLSHDHCPAQMVEEINDADGFPGAVESDAQKEINHFEWIIPAKHQHNVVMSCAKTMLSTRYLDDDAENQQLVIEHENTQLSLCLQTHCLQSHSLQTNSLQTHALQEHKLKMNGLQEGCVNTESLQAESMQTESV
ncbi:heparinase II/III family protein [Vibrio sp. FNV 38]|nr:heparinase II/III family protein [Vibrio sp. FNV 38]